MTNLRLAVAKFALATVMAGSLATVGSGVAGAAEVPTHGSGDQHVHYSSGSQLHKACERRLAVLSFEQRQQRRYAANTAVFVGLETKARSAGNTRLEAYWAKVVNRRDAYSARRHAALLKRTARAARSHRIVNGKCR